MEMQSDEEQTSAALDEEDPRSGSGSSGKESKSVCKNPSETKTWSLRSDFLPSLLLFLVLLLFSPVSLEISFLHFLALQSECGITGWGRRCTPHS